MKHGFFYCSAPRGIRTVTTGAIRITGLVKERVKRAELPNGSSIEDRS